MRLHSQSAPDSEARTTNDNLFDSYLTLSEAAKRLPGRPAPATLWRWSREGLNGIQLRTIRIGRKIHTRRDWLENFFLAVDPRDREAWQASQADTQAGGAR